MSVTGFWIVGAMPDGEVTRIWDAALRRFSPAFTFGVSAGSGTSRSSASGCSFETISSRAPPFRIAGSSGACNMPSTVRSANTLTR